jgi:XTP/dITP diphosphohydrolase
MPADHVPEFVIATRNRDKMVEIREIFDGFPFLLHDLASFPSAPEVEETGETLEENARLKAESASDSTGLIALADDSGLFVEALDGKPGVFSSRFAGEGATYTDNNRKLIDMMVGLPHEERKASFVCVVAVVFGDKSCEFFRGEVPGHITTELHGAEGFGYDPVFFYPPAGKTFAELSRTEKNRISHRYLAFSAARGYLEKEYGIDG